MMNVISLRGLGKSYAKEQGGLRRLREIVAGRPISPDQQIEVLKEIDLDIPMGQVVGIIGQNGAGKSTLLKVVAGMVPHTAGSIEVRGRVAALLELGSGFHPEMTGRENVYLSASLAGLKRDEIDEKYESIVTFSGIQPFIDRPVKTYSSGMMVRLAFSVATSVDPDILIIDEALSVGDGIFSRKSFERIMEFKERYKTILFCSHSLYQVESICDRVLWIDEGSVRESGSPKEVTAAYQDFLRVSEGGVEPLDSGDQQRERHEEHNSLPQPSTASILNVEVSADGQPGNRLEIESGQSQLRIEVDYSVATEIPAPSIAVVVNDASGQCISSAGSISDGCEFNKNEDGVGKATIEFEEIPLLKGNYLIDVYLMCEKGIHVYERLPSAASITVKQKGMEIGYVSLPHSWSSC
jgi:lipopolysaccharide transport system ATP-binding protein